METRLAPSRIKKQNSTEILNGKHRTPQGSPENAQKTKTSKDNAQGKMTSRMQQLLAWKAKRETNNQIDAVIAKYTTDDKNRLLDRQPATFKQILTLPESDEIHTRRLCHEVKVSHEPPQPATRPARPFHFGPYQDKMASLKIQIPDHEQPNPTPETPPCRRKLAVKLDFSSPSIKAMYDSESGVETPPRTIPVAQKKTASRQLSQAEPKKHVPVHMAHTVASLNHQRALAERNQRKSTVQTKIPTARNTKDSNTSSRNQTMKKKHERILNGARAKEESEMHRVKPFDDKIHDTEQSGEGKNHTELHLDGELLLRTDGNGYTRDSADTHQDLNEFTDSEDEDMENLHHDGFEDGCIDATREAQVDRQGPDDVFSVIESTQESSIPEDTNNGNAHDDESIHYGFGENVSHNFSPDGIAEGVSCAGESVNTLENANLHARETILDKSSKRDGEINDEKSGIAEVDDRQPEFPEVPESTDNAIVDEVNEISKQDPIESIQNQFEDYTLSSQSNHLQRSKTLEIDLNEFESSSDVEVDEDDDSDDQDFQTISRIDNPFVNSTPVTHRSADAVAPMRLKVPYALDIDFIHATNTFPSHGSDFSDSNQVAEEEESTAEAQRVTEPSVNDDIPPVRQIMRTTELRQRPARRTSATPPCLPNSARLHSKENNQNPNDDQQFLERTLGASTSMNKSNLKSGSTSIELPLAKLSFPSDNDDHVSTLSHPALDPKQSPSRSNNAGTEGIFTKRNNQELRVDRDMLWMYPTGTLCDENPAVGETEPQSSDMYIDDFVEMDRDESNPEDSWNEIQFPLPATQQRPEANQYALQQETTISTSWDHSGKDSLSPRNHQLVSQCTTTKPLASAQEQMGLCKHVTPSRPLEFSVNETERFPTTQYESPPGTVVPTSPPPVATDPNPQQGENVDDNQVSPLTLTKLVTYAALISIVLGLYTFNVEEFQPAQLDDEVVRLVSHVEEVSSFATEQDKKIHQWTESIEVEMESNAQKLHTASMRIHDDLGIFVNQTKTRNHQVMEEVETALTEALDQYQTSTEITLHQKLVDEGIVDPHDAGKELPGMIQSMENQLTLETQRLESMVDLKEAIQAQVLNDDIEVCEGDELCLLGMEPLTSEEDDSLFTIETIEIVEESNGLLTNDLVDLVLQVVVIVQAIFIAAMLIHLCRPYSNAFVDSDDIVFIPRTGESSNSDEEDEVGYIIENNDSLSQTPQVTRRLRFQPTPHSAVRRSTRHNRTIIINEDQS